MDRIIRGANWWIETTNQRLRTKSAKLPDLKRADEKFVAGGGFFTLSMPGEISELEADFELNGAHEDIRSLFGREPGDWVTFIYYERLAEITSGGLKNIGRVVRLKGLVTDVEQPKVEGMKADPTKIKMTSIVLYQDLVGGKNVHKFDWFNNQLIINGVDYTAEHNQLIMAA